MKNSQHSQQIRVIHRGPQSYLFGVTPTPIPAVRLGFESDKCRYFIKGAIVYCSRQSSSGLVVETAHKDAKAAIRESLKFAKLTPKAVMQMATQIGGIESKVYVRPCGVFVQNHSTGLDRWDWHMNEGVRSIPHSEAKKFLG